MKYNGESKPVTHIPYGHQCIDDADIAALVDAARSDWLTRGPKSEEFESALCEYTGAKYAVVVSSGTAALHIACLCAGVGAGDEVITTPMTFVASANSIMYCGARPVFADVLEDTVNIDPDEIKKRVSKSTKAIIPVHYAGHPAELDAIKGIADRSGLIVIEDAAHALGATYKGSAIGSCKYSDMTVFSFHPVKHITTGEGGAITTNREDLYKKLVMLRNHGITRIAYPIQTTHQRLDDGAFMIAEPIRTAFIFPIQLRYRLGEEGDPDSRSARTRIIKLPRTGSHVFQMRTAYDIDNLRIKPLADHFLPHDIVEDQYFFRNDQLTRQQKPPPELAPEVDKRDRFDAILLCRLEKHGLHAVLVRCPRHNQGGF